jgi:hypothetical protein
MAGRSNQTAGSRLDRRLDGTSASAVVWLVVVMFSVAVAGPPLRVTVAEGVKTQVANCGSVPQDKVIVLANELCGVSVSVNLPGCPAFTLVLEGVEVSAKSLTWKL